MYLLNKYNIDLSQGLFVKPNLTEETLQIIKKAISFCEIDCKLIQEYDQSKIKQNSVFVDIDEMNFSVKAIRIMKVSKIINPNGNLILNDIITIDENGKKAVPKSILPSENLETSFHF